MNSVADHQDMHQKCPTWLVLYKVPLNGLEVGRQIPNTAPALSDYPGLVNMPSSFSSLAILSWFFYLLLIYSFSTPSNATIHSNETDRLALLAIKSLFRDPLGVTNSWNNSVPLCLWTGVLCGRRHQRVTELDLRNQSIGGNLSPFIGNLSFLRSIHLEDNNFYGIIPNEVSFLFRLENLTLANNSFSGTIPKNLSSNLVIFRASRNKVHGEIPIEIGNLFKLERLAIGGNHLTGQLPASIGNLSALLVLDVPMNSLSGTIPYSLGQLKSLFFLQLISNNLFGTIHPSIFNISSLVTLNLGLNSFHGTLPSNIGNDLPKLIFFNINDNNFTGPLPCSLSNASNLEHIGLSKNYFNGKVLINFNGFKNLSILRLHENNLGTGTTNDLYFLTSLINCSKLDKIDLHKNQFGGMLPKFIGNFSKTITILVLNTNYIYGSIPPSIGNLVNLDALALYENQLSGTIPQAIGELKNLHFLYLDGNRLQGSIPTFLGNLTLLNELTLSSNRLQGNISSSLGNCQHLTALILDNNNLTGIVPQQILITTTLYLHLAGNHLSGPFPSQLGNLKTLIELDISRNNFCGEIPSTLGSCTSLEILNLNDNSFSGRIPSSLNSLRSNQELNLASNNLSGEIPEYLENLTFLVYLNLSFNHFEGEVPIKGIFSNKTGISLAGNKKLCGGLVEMHLPACPSTRLKKSKIPLLKVIIPVIVSCLFLTSAFIIIILSRKRSAENSSTTLHIDEQFPLVSYAELSKATDNFSSSNIIGQGSYGLVYKGILGETRKLVAVKVINLQQKGGSKSFISECEALRNIRHRNLVKIITICSSVDPKGADFKALIYEYMENRSLEEWLHCNEDQLDRSNLSLIQRLNIAIDVAFAVEYLHHHCESPMVHGDLKATNVLLDHDMVAYVGDFGLSKFLFNHPLNTTPRIESSLTEGLPLSVAPEAKSSSIMLRGTIGYVAPEYGVGNEVSIIGDVYSFGILLLEIFTGKRPTNSMFDDELTLHEFVKMALTEGVMEIVEPSIVLEIIPGNNNVENFARLTRERRGRIQECLVGVLRIGVFCSMESPAERMEMTDVVAKLCVIRKNFLGRRI